MAGGGNLWSGEFGSIFVMLFMDGTLSSYDDEPRNDHEFFVAYPKALVKRGVFEMPENVGRSHISYSHTRDDIARTLHIAREALTETRDAFAMSPAREA